METAKILVVDDEQHNLQTLVDYLEQAPGQQRYELLAAPNGVVACQIVQDALPDLVITDWEMPMMDGMTLLKTLKADPATQDIPVLMVTGIHLGAEGLRMALEEGAMDYIRKPVEKVELWARVASALRLAMSYRQIQAQNTEIQEQNVIIRQQKDRELSAKLLELQQKSRELEDLKKELEHIHVHAEAATQQKLSKVIRQLGYATSSIDDWTSFQQQFEKVHPSFFGRIKTAHPKLTNDDLRYCAYVHMNLSNNEIAQLLNIAPESVRTHKYRLKKKLAPPAGQDLAEYLQQMQEG